MLNVISVDHFVLNVRDVKTSADWYERVLGMTREEDQPNGGTPRTSVKFGTEKINLRPINASTVEWFTAEHPATGSGDLCFLTNYSPEEVSHHLSANGVEIVLGPVTKSGAMGKICSVYCRDPDGNLIEISSSETPPGPSRS
ncbi:VOC family protein [Hyphomicrobium sp. 99]|uniref:VOC family protein n=1 Tax=Hyphomicrobium sp. 99 TaxID=1163419 RepID=UPI0005F85488|nr:VOC family protein [Hyphomicrobium sp. 99]